MDPLVAPWVVNIGLYIAGAFIAYGVLTITNELLGLLVKPDPQWVIAGYSLIWPALPVLWLVEILWESIIEKINKE